MTSKAVMRLKQDIGQLESILSELYREHIVEIFNLKEKLLYSDFLEIKNEDIENMDEEGILQLYKGMFECYEGLHDIFDIMQSKHIVSATVSQERIEKINQFIINQYIINEIERVIKPIILNEFLINSTCDEFYDCLSIRCKKYLDVSKLTQRELKDTAITHVLADLRDENVEVTGFSLDGEIRFYTVELNCHKKSIESCIYKDGYQEKIQYILDDGELDENAYKVGYIVRIVN